VGQATYSPDALEIAQKVFRPDLYDAAIGSSAVPARHVPDGVGAFDGARLIRTTLPGISRPSPSSGVSPKQRFPPFGPAYLLCDAQYLSKCHLEAAVAACSR
jgi:hypothetical protein